MTIPTSTVPAARQYLVTGIRSAAGSQAEVFDGDADHLDHENWITVGGVTRQVAPLAMVGNGGQFWREERYSVAIEINCFVAGRENSMQQANTNAYALLAIVESVVRQDPSLGGLVIQAAPKSSTSIPSWDEEGQGAELILNASIEVYTTL